MRLHFLTFSLLYDGEKVRKCNLIVLNNPSTHWWAQWMPSFRIQRRCSCVATRWPARTCATWLWVRAIVSRLCAPHAKCGLSTRHQYGIIRSGTIRNCHFPSRPEGAWPPQIAVPIGILATLYATLAHSLTKAVDKRPHCYCWWVYRLGLISRVVRCPLLGDWKSLSSLVKSIWDKWTVRCTKVSPLLVRYWRS